MKRLMMSDFSQPQRQSLIGVLVMFADTFQKALRALWPLLIVWILKIDESNKAYFGLGALAIIIVVAIIAYLKYLNFTFFLDDVNEEFVIKKGILTKSRIAIPLDKIQQVNINQSLIQKIIGVHALEVDTAGSSGKEVAIRAIKHDLALSLKERLMEEGEKKQAILDEAAYVNSTKHAEHSFIEISLVNLLKTGITSNYSRSFALLLAFVITTFQYIEDYIRYAGYEEDPLRQYLDPQVLLRFITFIVIGILVVTLLINLTRTIVRYFNFRITKQQSSLLLSYGLLNTKNTIIRPDKVQIVTIGRNFFQKKLNINDIRIRQASGVEPSDKDQKKTAIEIPGCNNAEKDGLMEFLLGSIPQRGVALKPNIRKIIMGVVGGLMIPLGIFMLSYYLTPSITEYLIFVPVYVLFVSLMIYFNFRHSRLFVADDFIIKRSGAWDIDYDYIAPHKIQSISLKQFFWHKSPDVGIVSLHTAGGTISFGLANFTRLKEMVNYWLYQVETTDKHWM